MTLERGAPSSGTLPVRPRMRRVGGAWIAETALVAGDVVLGEDANLWFGAVVRGDDAPVRIGARTNVQDGCVVHEDPGVENVIGAEVTIGHGAVCHGAAVGDRALIGMGAVLLERSVIGEGAFVAAGAVVAPRTVVEPYTLVMGVPARFVRKLDEEERRQGAIWKAERYVMRAREYAEGVYDGQPRS